MARMLIVNADDFGASSAVNHAVLRAHREGILTSASLMVTGDAADEAVLMARENPSLAVGLHLALTNARPVLPREVIPRLRGADGRLPSSDVRAALRYFFDWRARDQLRLEIEAQFDGFTAYGIPLSHVDGHQHMHAHPAVISHVVELAVRHGAKGIRVPHEPALTGLMIDSSRPGYKLSVILGHALLAAACRRALRGKPLASCEVVVGSLMSGAMSDDYVIRSLSRVRAANVEVFFHPSEDDSGDAFGPNRGDLNALLSVRLREFVVGEGFRLAAYPDLCQGVGQCRH